MTDRENISFLRTSVGIIDVCKIDDEKRFSRSKIDLYIFDSLNSEIAFSIDVKRKLNILNYGLNTRYEWGSKREQISFSYLERSEKRECSNRALFRHRDRIKGTSTSSARRKEKKKFCQIHRLEIRYRLIPG